MVEIFEANSAAPTIPQRKDLPARKYPWLVNFIFRTERIPMAKIPHKYPTMMTRSSKGMANSDPNNVYRLHPSLY
jgi:hypothetical protein